MSGFAWIKTLLGQQSSNECEILICIAIHRKEAACQQVIMFGQAQPIVAAVLAGHIAAMSCSHSEERTQTLARGERFQVRAGAQCLAPNLVQLDLQLVACPEESGAFSLRDGGLDVEGLSPVVVPAQKVCTMAGQRYRPPEMKVRDSSTCIHSCTDNSGPPMTSAISAGR